MPADPTLQPFPTDMELATLRKINQIASGLVAPDPDLVSNPHDVEFMSLRKINQLLWNLLDAGIRGGQPMGPWVPVPVDPGYTGGTSTIQARWILDPTNGSVELKGSITGGASWSGSQQTVANLPAGLTPSVVRASLIISGLGTTPDSASCLLINVTGALLLSPLSSFIYSTTPDRAFFDGIIFPLT
jgi:hypothetical protein